MTESAPSPELQTEQELIATAQNAVSQCNWVVGECAARWTKKYAKGRTDADFGALVGLSGDQVYQRRRVWEAFGDVAGDYLSLKWSHFYVALNWDDAPECLQWAEEMQATVAEMKAWRRAQRGEDLTTDPAEDEFVNFLPTEPTAVRDPDEFGGNGSRREGGGASENRHDEEHATVAGHARQSDEFDASYAPFREGAGHPAPQSESAETAVADKPRPSTEQIIRRMVSSLQRFNKAFTPELEQEFAQLPEKLRQQLLDAVEDLNSHITRLT